VVRRWKRYGRAAVVIGEPFSVGEWLDDQSRAGRDIFTVDRAERVARVQVLAEVVLEKIAALVPVTSVTLACAALQSFDGDFVSHAQLVERMSEMREVLRELNGRVIHREGSAEEIFDRAWRMLSMRRMLVNSGGGYAILAGNRPLISYYANSIAHLLGPFAEGVRRRDRLPALDAG
jgi:glycerol-3-phosphate O-acyltransferase